MIPGEWLLAEDPIEINQGRRKLAFRSATPEIARSRSAPIFTSLRSTGCWSSTAATLGMRLDVPSGQSIRFEAGDEREVDLVAFGGHRRVIGFSGFLDGAVPPVGGSGRWRRANAGFAATRDGRNV